MQTRPKQNSSKQPNPTQVKARPQTPPPAEINPFAQGSEVPQEAQAGAQQTYPVPVDGQMVELTLDELIQAASLGLSKQNAYIRRNRAANGIPNGQIYAYRKWEILELKDELAAMEMNQKNRRAAVGPAQSDGEPAGVDPVTLALLGR